MDTLQLVRSDSNGGGASQVIYVHRLFTRFESIIDVSKFLHYCIPTGQPSITNTTMQIFLLAILSVANGMLASAKSPVKSLKVIYFDARGAAELTRIILKVGKINFEDLRVPLVMKPGGGFEMPEYEAAKARGDYAANMNRLPLLESKPSLNYDYSLYICLLFMF
jgi:hypothetical protein